MKIELAAKIMNMKFPYESYGNFLKGKGIIMLQILKMIKQKMKSLIN